MSFERTVILPVDADTAFELVTNPERLRRWHTVANRVDLQIGGSYRFTMGPGHQASGTFTEIEPGASPWAGKVRMPCPRRLDGFHHLGTAGEGHGLDPAP